MLWSLQLHSAFEWEVERNREKSPFQIESVWEEEIALQALHNLQFYDCFLECGIWSFVEVAKIGAVNNLRRKEKSVHGGGERQFRVFPGCFTGFSRERSDDYLLIAFSRSSPFSPFSFSFSLSHWNEYSLYCLKMKGNNFLMWFLTEMKIDKRKRAPSFLLPPLLCLFEKSSLCFQCRPS